jgi:hypothetical protein
MSSVHFGINAARGECFVTHWANGWRTGATFCCGARQPELKLIRLAADEALLQEGSLGLGIMSHYSCGTYGTTARTGSFPSQTIIA